ncbi:MAG TPA: DoxX family protein [Chitinophagaceae bacterium]
MNRFLSSHPLWATAGLALVRIITGLLMVYHGWEVFDEAKMNEYATWDSFKSYSSPATMAYIGKVGELIAGVLLTLGLFTRLASIIIAGIMFYISVIMGNGKVWYDDQHPFLFVLLALVFFFTGGGRYSLDYVLFSKRSYV